MCSAIVDFSEVSKCSFAFFQHTSLQFDNVHLVLSLLEKGP